MSVVGAMVVALAPASGSPTSPGFDSPVPGAFGLTPNTSTTRAAPDLVDLDADGDLDALIGNSSGATEYFQNTGTASAPAFTLSIAPFGGVGSVGTNASPDLVDIDGDADLDALVGNGSGNTVLFRNSGAEFGNAQANPFGLTNVGTNATPEFVDIDGDLDLDAFLGNGAGNTLFFRNTGSLTAPAFATAQTNPFGLTAVTGSASPKLADIDADGDLDALIGNGGGDTVLFRNSGTPAVPQFAAGVTNPFGLQGIGFNNPASPDLVDLDDDLDLDAVIGGSTQQPCPEFPACPFESIVWYFGNVGAQGTPVYTTPVTNPFGLVSTGTNASPSIVDVDSDGDLDAFVGNNDGIVRFFRATGRPPSFGTPTANPFGLTDVGVNASPVLVDIDGDLDFDAFVGNENGNSVYFQNTGGTTPVFAAPVTVPFNIIDAGSSASPDFGDIDGDGDLDAFVGNASGTIHYFRNNGTAEAPAFGSRLINPFGITTVGIPAAPDLVDIDRDGDLDLFVGTGAGNTHFFRNIGTASSPSFRSPVTDPFGLAPVGTRSAPELVDVEEDGDQDAFVGNGAGNIIYFANLINLPPTDIAIAGGSVRENQAVGTAVGTFSATDPDGSETFTFALVPGTGAGDNAHFSIVGTELRTASIFDFEDDTSKRIRVRVTDSMNNTFEEVLTITILNAPEAPTDITLSSSSIAENRPSGTAVGSFTAVDPDAGGSHSFALISGTGSDDNGQFQIVGSQLQTTTPFDFEADPSKSIRVRTTDGNALSFDKIFTITVTDAADAPTDILLSNSSVAENAPVRTVVGLLSATDQDPSDTFTFSLVVGPGGDDNGSFQIDGTELETTSIFDRETDASYTVRVRATDSTGGTFEEIFPITITDVAEPPTDLLLSNASVAENLASNTFVGTLSAVDPDQNDAKTFTLVAGPGDTENAQFQIVGTSLRTAATFDFEVDNSKSIRVRVTDSANNTYEEAFTINVTNGPDAPTDITLTRSSTAENQAVGSFVSGLGVVDQDTGEFGHTFSLVSGTGSEDNAHFQISGNQLQTAVVFDYETDPSKSIRIRVTDPTSLTYEEAVVITVTDTLDAPTDIALSNTSVAEAQSGATVGTLSATDPDPGDTHTFTVPFVPGTDNASFQIVGTELRTAEPLDFESDPSKQIRVRATDSHGLTRDEFFTIAITDVNEAPTTITMTNASVNENVIVGASVGVFLTDDPDAGEVPSYALVDGVGDDDNEAFDISLRTLRTTQTFNHEVDDSKSIRVRVTDSANHTFERAFTIFIVDVAEAPTDVMLSTGLVQESRPSGTVVGFLAAADEDVNDGHAFQLLAGQLDNAEFVIHGDELRTAASFDFEADPEKSVKIRAKDRSGLIRDEVFVITVINRHSFISVDDVIAAEGKKGTKPFTFTISRTGDLRGAVDVQIVVRDLNAKAGKDYIHPFGESRALLAFADNEVAKNLTVMVIGDKKVEKHECFIVELFAQENTWIGDGKGCGRIKNDDR